MATIRGSDGQTIEQTSEGVLVNGSLWWGHTLDSINGVYPGLIPNAPAPTAAPPSVGALGAFLQANPGGSALGIAPDAASTGPGGVPIQGRGADQGARAQLNSTLARYGLQGLGDWAWQQYIAGIPVEQIMLDVRQRPEYKQRFPYMESLAQKGRAISESSAIDLERAYSQVAQQFGLPKGFYDSPEDFRRWMENDVAPTELRDRLGLYSQAASEFATLPDVANTVSEMRRLYGIDASSGEFLAWFVDPERSMPLIERTVGAGRLSAVAGRSGYGGLEKSEAEALQGLGTTPEQAVRGFGELVRDSELFEELPGESYVQLGGITKDAQLGATFGGDAASREAIERKRRARLAVFGGGGGGYAAGRAGLAGAGTAST